MANRWSSASSSIETLEGLYSGSVFIAHSLYRLVVAGVRVDSLSFHDDESWKDYTKEERDSFEATPFWRKHKDSFAKLDYKPLHNESRHLDTAQVINGVLRNPQAWHDDFYIVGGVMRHILADAHDQDVNYAKIAQRLFACVSEPIPKEMWMALFIGNNVGNEAPRNLSNFVERIKKKTDATTAIMRMALAAGSSSYMLEILRGDDDSITTRVLDDALWLKGAGLDTNDAVLLAMLDIHLGNPCLFVPEVHSLVSKGYELDEIIHLRKIGITDSETMLAVLENLIDDETLRTIIGSKVDNCRAFTMVSRNPCDS